MADDNDITSLRLKIEGHVQGVGYRAYAANEARKLLLDGWVRNIFDGSVEILVSGPTEQVETFVGLCMRGPQWSNVTNVDLHRAEPPKLTGFHIASTY
jgi:acylphosphatase